jgi:hypothetical protein
VVLSEWLEVANVGASGDCAIFEMPMESQIRRGFRQKVSFGKT